MDSGGMGSPEEQKPAEVVHGSPAGSNEPRYVIVVPDSEPFILHTLEGHQRRWLYWNRQSELFLLKGDRTVYKDKASAESDVVLIASLYPQWIGLVEIQLEQ